MIGLPTPNAGSIVEIDAQTYAIKNTFRIGILLSGIKGVSYDFSGTYDASDSAFLNQWIHMVATSNSSESKLYLNGQLVTGGNRASTDEDFGKNFRIGTRYTTSAEWTGYMGPIYLYDRALSAQEALEVFNAHKIRFGK